MGAAPLSGQRTHGRRNQLALRGARPIALGRQHHVQLLLCLFLPHVVTGRSRRRRSWAVCERTDRLLRLHVRCARNVPWARDAAPLRAVASRRGAPSDGASNLQNMLLQLHDLTCVAVLYYNRQACV